jgi:glycosyltransferase involved in cell wall biosynthesis
MFGVRRLVFVTQQVDPGHPALGATVAKLAALARLADEVAVLADGAVPGALPENCRVRTFASRTKPARGLRFEAALARELKPRPIAVVAHMCPIYAVLAAPLARPLRIPVVLWYTHWHASATLRWAARVSTRIASVDHRSFPLASRKVRAIGHGIDIAEFTCRERTGEENGAVRALALGRYSPSKGLQTVVHAVRLAFDDGVDVRLEVHGPTLSELEKDHRRALGRLVEALELTDRVELGDPLPRDNVPRLFAKSDVLVNNMRAGAPDKVVYEAAASCLPVLASNPVFDTLLAEPFRFGREEPAELADRLIAFAALSDESRREVGRELRSRVESEHAVERWAERLLAVAEER